MEETSFTPKYTKGQRIPPTHGTKERGFVVFSLVHTVTDLIIELLRTNPEILMHGELFNDIEAQAFRVSDLGSWTMDTRDEQPLEFLSHMYRCPEKFVGFLSRPEDWTNRQDVLQKIVNDPVIKKVVVTGDPLRSFAVVCKKLSTDELFCPQMTISPSGIQQFICRVKNAEQYYKALFSSSQVLWLNYDEFIFNAAETSWKLFSYLGVTPAETPRSRMKILAEREFCPVGLLKRHACERAYDLVKYSLDLKEVANNEEEPLSFNYSSSQIKDSRPICVKAKMKKENIWALLVPVKSTYLSYDWSGLETFFHTLIHSLPAESRERVIVHFGIDQRDGLKSIFSSKVRDLANGIKCTMTILNEEEGHVCKIWNKLAEVAINNGCSFFVFLGDDITFEGYGWMVSIEGKFEEISSKTTLRYGVGCVAFNDLSFPNFPTFPVLHRSHIHLFGKVFSRRFINQGADSYLFGLYDRLGAAVIDKDAKLRNNIGGNSASRYEKRSIRFKNAILSQSLQVLRKKVWRGLHFAQSGCCRSYVSAQLACFGQNYKSSRLKNDD